jgi:hypothetical protein
MPRSLSASVMPVRLVMPAARSSAMMGARSAASLLARAWRATNPARWTAGVNFLGMIFAPPACAESIASRPARRKLREAPRAPGYSGRPLPISLMGAGGLPGAGRLDAIEPTTSATTAPHISAALSTGSTQGGYGDEPRLQGSRRRFHPCRWLCKLNWPLGGACESLTRAFPFVGCALCALDWRCRNPCVDDFSG